MAPRVVEHPLGERSTESDERFKRPGHADHLIDETANSPTPDTPASAKQMSMLPLRPRTTSPFGRRHLRSKSSTNSLAAPPMTRAHSSPTTDNADQVLMSTIMRPPRSPSPLSALSRRRSPMRRPPDEAYSSFGNQIDIGETISENSELHLTPRGLSDNDNVPSSPSSNHYTFPRSRRRPASPLHHIAQSSPQVNPRLRTSTSSPSLAAALFNEPYPSSYTYASSSIPSTPTSLRSRSPSISSLETIPDSPDAEAEAETIARLKAAADRESQGEGGEGARRRSSMDTQGRSGVMALGSGSFGGFFGGRDKRKRWSVCGAERRGDLDLETIWED